MDDMVNDVYSAVMWTRNNIANYGGDPNNVILVGHSAGAQLSILTFMKSALNIRNHGRLLEKLPFIRKLVLLSGPYDFDNYSILKQYFDIEAEEGIAKRIMNELLKSDNTSPTEILSRFRNVSVGPNVFPKIVFFHTSGDHIIPSSSTNGLIYQLRRVVQNININNIDLNNGWSHNTLTRGVRSNNQYYKDTFINLIQS